jgi:DNA-binding NtrC family response regulator
MNALTHSMPTPVEPQLIEGLISELAGHDTGLTGQHPRERVRLVLKRLVAELGFEDATLQALEIDRAGTTALPAITTAHSLPGAVLDLPAFPWLQQSVMRGDPLILSTGETYPSDVPAADLEPLWSAGIRTIVSAPWRRPGGESAGAAVLTLSHQPALPTFPRLVALAEAGGRLMVSDLPGGQSSSIASFGRSGANPSSAAVARNTSERTRSHTPAGNEIVGESDAWKYVMFRVDQVASTQATVLLLGETGTGKEIVAREIHQRGARRHARFIAINCAALPAPLIESELFGHERGAYTGAYASQAGRFELANRGTLFLDEAADLPLELQPKLLRVLQEGQLDRLGGARTVTVDVRIIAATNRDLASEVKDGRFRRDLYYRLNVFPITLPALRDRRDDIPHLVRHLVARFAQRFGRPAPEVPPAAMKRLMAYAWPGNIRELENVIQRAIILSADAVLSLGEFNALGSPESGPPSLSASMTLEAVEREHILKVLSTTSWRIEGSRGAARVLGLQPSTLRSRLQKLGIRRGH